MIRSTDIMPAQTTTTIVVRGIDTTMTGRIARPC